MTLHVMSHSQTIIGSYVITRRRLLTELGEIGSKSSWMTLPLEYTPGEAPTVMRCTFTLYPYSTGFWLHISRPPHGFTSYPYSRVWDGYTPGFYPLPLLQSMGWLYPRVLPLTLTPEYGMAIPQGFTPYPYSRVWDGYTPGFYLLPLLQSMGWLYPRVLPLTLTPEYWMAIPQGTCMSLPLTITPEYGMAIPQGMSNCRGRLGVK